jgi:hypothetical protein
VAILRDCDLRVTSNCKKLKVFEEMDIRKEQFWQMEELQNKHSKEKNYVSEPDQKLSECKSCRILSGNSTIDIVAS